MCLHSVRQNRVNHKVRNRLQHNRHTFRYRRKICSDPKSQGLGPNESEIQLLREGKPWYILGSGPVYRVPHLQAQRDFQRVGAVSGLVLWVCSSDGYRAPQELQPDRFLRGSVARHRCSAVPIVDGSWWVLQGGRRWAWASCCEKKARWWFYFRVIQSAVMCVVCVCVREKVFMFFCFLFFFSFLFHLCTRSIS